RTVGEKLSSGTIVRRRCRGALRELRAGRTGGVRLCRHRLGTAALLRAVVRAMSSYTVLNPATEEPVTTVPGTSAEETDAAIALAQAAQRSWRAVSPGERAALLRSFAGQVDAHAEELAQL